MEAVSRRRFLHALPGLAVVTRAATDIRIDEIRHTYEDYIYRAPYKFGGRVVDRVTLLNVRCRVTTRSGKAAWGFGSMTLGNMWAFPSKTMSYDTTLDAMKALAERIGRITADCKEVGHPLDLAHALDPQYVKAASEVSSARKLDEPIPRLCTLVVASPFDAAIHDAFGKVHGRNVYETYGPDLLPHDLSRYLGPAFRGERLDRALLAKPQERIPLFHSVGGLDPLEAKDVERPLRDGLPETLPDWIAWNGLVRIKIKLSGDDLAWDVGRTLAIDRITSAAQARRGVTDWSVLPRLQRAVPGCGVRALLPSTDSRRHARWIPPDSLRGAADGTRPRGESAQRDARSGAASSRRDRRVADRSREPAAGARDGIHGSCLEGVQRAEPRHADGGGRAEVQDVRLRSGSHLPRRFADSLRRNFLSRACGSRD